MPLLYRLLIILSFFTLGLDSTSKKSAIDYYSKGEYDQAILILKEEVSNDPTDIRARKFLMMLYSLKGYFSSLEQEAQEIIKLAPNDIESHNYLMMSLFMQGKLDAAIAEAEIILKLDSTYAQAYYHLGMIYEIKYRSKKRDNREDLNKSISNFKKVLELKPNDLSVYNHLMREYLTIGEAGEAVKLGQEALSVKDPKEPSYRYEIMYALSLSYAKQGDIKGSLKWLKKAIETDSEFKKKAIQENEEFGAVKDTEEFRKLILEK